MRFRGSKNAQQVIFAELIFPGNCGQTFDQNCNRFGTLDIFDEREFVFSLKLEEILHNKIPQKDGIMS